jgi:hypothetical protein
MQSLYPYIGNINNLKGISGLGAGTVAGQATAGLSVALATAAILDPEPFSKVALAIAAGLVTLFQSVFGVGNGCGQTCVQATAIANQVATLLTQNMNNYISQPVRTASMQAAALSVFDQAWTSLQQGCAAIKGAAGTDCVSDRAEGACKWMASPGGWVTNADGTCTFNYWGAAGSGSSCWNWFNGMRDPIANDPCVIPDSAVNTVSTLASGASSAALALGIPTTIVSGVDTGVTDLFSNPLLLIAGVALVVVVGNT